MIEDEALAGRVLGHLPANTWSFMIAGVCRVKKTSIWVAGVTTAALVALSSGLIVATRPSPLMAYATTIAVGAALVFTNTIWLVRRIEYRRVVAPLRSLLTQALQDRPNPGDLTRLILSGSTLAGSFKLEATSADDRVYVQCTNFDNTDYRRSWYWWSNAAK